MCCNHAGEEKGRRHWQQHRRNAVYWRRERDRIAVNRQFFGVAKMSESINDIKARLSSRVIVMSITALCKPNSRRIIALAAWLQEALRHTKALIYIAGVVSYQAVRAYIELFIALSIGRMLFAEAKERRSI